MLSLGSIDYVRFASKINHYNGVISCCTQRIEVLNVNCVFWRHRFAVYSKPSKPSLSVSASSASFTGSSGEFSEQLLDTKTKQKTRRIAGIDQDELLDPTLLADPDSCFCEFRGVHLHYKLCDAKSEEARDSLESESVSQLPQIAGKNIGFPMILLHGFGASVYSWCRVMRPLAQLTGSKVLAFDRPAFGLTSRVDVFRQAIPLNPYSMTFSVLATLHFIDFLKTEKAILVGHSAGSLVAVDSYFEAPERVAALILIAPAIFAPGAKGNPPKGNKSVNDNLTEGPEPDSSVLAKPFIKLFKIISKFCMVVASAIMQTMKRMMEMVNTQYKKALSAILRSAFGVMLIRMIIDKFGVPAVRTAWHDSKKVDEDVINGYTKPLRAKDWDKALAEFTAATLASLESNSKPPLSKRLHDISCPVLIITGDNDRIVPAWNAARLAQAIPRACLEVIKNCGHLPHEEKVEEFVSIAERFLQRAFHDSSDMSLQTAH